MTAIEAHEISRVNKNKVLEKQKLQLNSIVERIKLEAFEGLNEIEIQIFDEQKIHILPKLKELGYNVKQYIHDSYTIKW